MTDFTFTVTRSDAEGTSIVNWQVVGSGVSPANAEDFIGGELPAGVLTFINGQTTRTITVQVNPDNDIEPDETFQVVLSNPINCTLSASFYATGTIRNDDGSGDKQLQIHFTTPVEGSLSANALILYDTGDIELIPRPDNQSSSTIYVNGYAIDWSTGVAVILFDRLVDTIHTFKMYRSIDYGHSWTEVTDSLYVTHLTQALEYINGLPRFQRMLVIHRPDFEGDPNVFLAVAYSDESTEEGIRHWFSYNGSFWETVSISSYWVLNYANGNVSTPFSLVWPSKDVSIGIDSTDLTFAAPRLSHDFTQTEVEEGVSAITTTRYTGFNSSWSATLAPLAHADGLKYLMFASVSIPGTKSDLITTLATNYSVGKLYRIVGDADPWQYVLTLDMTSAKIVALLAYDTDFYIVDDVGTVYKSTDLGDSWDRQGDVKTLYLSREATQVNTETVVFSDSGQLFCLAAVNAVSPIRLYFSGDFGVTWTLVPETSDYKCLSFNERINVEPGFVYTPA